MLPQIVFSLLCSFLCFHVVLSRSLPSQSHQVLDVSVTLQQAGEVFSSKSKTFDYGQLVTSSSSSSSSSSLSLSLHPRSSLLKPIHNHNYTSLTLSRLARDSSRVNSLNSHHQLALSGYSRSDFKPVYDTVVQPEDLQSPITSGTRQGSGEYFTRIGVGQPAKEFYMVIDTGSDISWLQCAPCSDCYQQSDPVFNPSASSTYKALTCHAPQCTSLEVSACRTDTCLYQVSYGDGSYTVGDFVTETVSFGRSGSVPGVAIGCGHENEGLFIGAAGLLGLGGGSLSLPSQIKATSFSYCLVDRDANSASTLEFNSARPGDSVLAPLLTNSRISTFFYVGLTGLSVGAQMLQIPASTFEIDSNGRGGIIVDSGTAVTRLRTEAYNALRDKFVELSQHLRSSSSFSLFDTCYDLSSLTKVSVPTVALHFSGGKTLQLHPNNYLIPVDSAGKFCLAFAANSGSLSIIGNIQQQGTRVSYDLANKVVGFSPNKC